MNKPLTSCVAVAFIAVATACGVNKYTVNADFKNATVERATQGSDSTVRYLGETYDWMTVDEDKDGLGPYLRGYPNNDKDQTIDKVLRREKGTTEWQEVTDDFFSTPFLATATARHDREVQNSATRRPFYN